MWRPAHPGPGDGHDGARLPRVEAVVKGCDGNVAEGVIDRKDLYRATAVACSGMLCMQGGP